MFSLPVFCCCQFSFSSSNVIDEPFQLLGQEFFCTVYFYTHMVCRYSEDVGYLSIGKSVEVHENNGAVDF